MEVDDFILSSDDDLVIQDGDLLIGKSDQQHVEHILRADLGHYRQHPLVGLGASKLLGGSFSPQQLKQDIRLQLKQDDYNVRQIIVDRDFNISIDAERIK